jgi:hypothetical protein
MDFPGKTVTDNTKFELDYWEKYGGVKKFDLHLPIYQKIFPMMNLDFEKEVILDGGSGAISVFEKLAPANAKIVPFDILASDYNRIVPLKKFQIQNEILRESSFSLITLFNMLDHVDDPEDLLIFVSSHLRNNGRIWMATHIGQPHGKLGHPQNFSCRTLIRLVSWFFSIQSCGVIREGIPIPYLWFGILGPKSIPGQNIFINEILLSMEYFRLQASRIFFKVLKLIGLKRILPLE